MLEKTEDRQIKGECQLTDLAKGVDFINQKFDEYEKDRREKDAVTATLQSELKSASMKVEDIEKNMDRKEQYSKRNCILIHGLKEEQNESIDDRVLELFREELNEDILLVDLDRTHRIGKRRLFGTIFGKRFSGKNSRENILALHKNLLGTE